MGDVKDILGMGRATEPHAPKIVKAKMKRPEGMSREAFALLGDSHPITATQAAELLQPKKKDAAAKAKPSTKGIVTWRWLPIQSSARIDGAGGGVQIYQPRPP